MSLLPELTPERRAGTVQVLSALRASAAEALESTDAALAERVAYLSWLTYERMLPILGYSVPGNLLLLAAGNATGGFFILSVSHLGEAIEILTTGRLKWAIQSGTLPDE